MAVYKWCFILHRGSESAIHKTFSWVKWQQSVWKTKRNIVIGNPFLYEDPIKLFNII